MEVDVGHVELSVVGVEDGGADVGAVDGMDEGVQVGVDVGADVGAVEKLGGRVGEDVVGIVVGDCVGTLPEIQIAPSMVPLLVGTHPPSKVEATNIKEQPVVASTLEKYRDMGLE